MLFYNKIRNFTTVNDYQMPLGLLT